MKIYTFKFIIKILIIVIKVEKSCKIPIIKYLAILNFMEVA